MNYIRYPINITDHRSIHIGALKNDVVINQMLIDAVKSNAQILIYVPDQADLITKNAYGFSSQQFQYLDFVNVNCGDL